MKTKLLAKAVTLTFVGAISAYSLQASANAVTFSQSSGFDIPATYSNNGATPQNDIVWYNDILTGVAPQAGYFDTIAWGLPTRNQNSGPNSGNVAYNPFGPTGNTGNYNTALSGLKVTGLSGNLYTGASATDWGGWTSISTVYHQNNIISASAYVLDSSAIYSLLTLGAGPGAGNVVPITSFFETSNSSCDPLNNPLGSTCDDRLTFTLESFAPIFFTDNGIDYEAEFQLGNFFNSASNYPNCALTTGECTIWTAEGTTSSLDVQARIRAVRQDIPEPATAALLGLGLLGLAGLRRRAKV